MGELNMLKKTIAMILLSGFLITLGVTDYANAATSSEMIENANVLDLEGINLSSLEPGDEIKLKDITIKQYSNEEAAKLISKESGKTENEILAILEENDKVCESQSVKQETRSISTEGSITPMATCATGATAFSRSLNVTSSYKPQLNVWTELCKNSAGQFVIKSIVDITMNRNYNGTVKQFTGKVVAKALNEGKTLYYSAEGDFYHNGTTTIGGSAGLNTAVASVNFNISNSSNYYAYLHQYDNIVLFK